AGSIPNVANYGSLRKILNDLFARADTVHRMLRITSLKRSGSHVAVVRLDPGVEPGITRFSESCSEIIVFSNIEQRYAFDRRNEGKRISRKNLPSVRWRLAFKRIENRTILKFDSVGGLPGQYFGGGGAMVQAI